MLYESAAFFLCKHLHRCRLACMPQSKILDCMFIIIMANKGLCELYKKSIVLCNDSHS